MIKLTEKYYVDSDELNYILKEKRIISKEGSKNIGKETYDNLGYYGSLKDLKRAIVEKEIKADLKLLENIDRIIKMIEEI